MTTTNTNISDIQDLVRILEQRPEWRSELQRILLTQELMETPARLNRLTETVEKLSATVDTLSQNVAGLTEAGSVLQQHAEATNRWLDSIESRLDNIEGGLDKLEDTVAALVQHAEATNRRLDSIDTTIKRLDGSVGDLKGHFASLSARENAVVITTLLDFEWRRTLELHEPVVFWQTAQRQGLTEGVSYGDKRSFWEADVIIEALTDDGQNCYIVVEASYTADSRDTNRAIRNAEFLTRFTGVRSFPAIASTRIDNDIADLVKEIPMSSPDTSKVFWHKLPEPKSAR